MPNYSLVTDLGEICGGIFEVIEGEDLKEKAVDEYYKWINNPKYFERSQEIPKECLYQMFDDDSEADEGGGRINIIKVIDDEFLQKKESGDK
jgi:hypothetical protein